MQQERFHTERARELRREMTPTEKRLWSHLRGRRFAGFKFRRQTPISGYIADFYCTAARLILELDGESHVGKEPRDEKRREATEAKGFKVLRIWDTHIYDDLDAVLELIWRECEARGGSRPPHPQPLSPEGRGEQEKQPLTPDPSPPRGEGRKTNRNV
jgi:very-short-patch-repair endonuclease